MHTAIPYRDTNECSTSGLNLLLHFLLVLNDSMRPAEAPGSLDLKRQTKANMLMVVGKQFLGQKVWEKHQRLPSNKESQGCNHHDLAQHGNDAKLKSVHVMPKL